MQAAAAVELSRLFSNMTDKEYNAFYHTGAWKRKRLEILRRDHFECQECWRRIRKAKETGERLAGADAKIRRAVCVHHIRELKDCWELRLDNDNLESLCGTCHNALHGREMDKWRFTSKWEEKQPERW